MKRFLVGYLLLAMVGFAQADTLNVQSFLETLNLMKSNLEGREDVKSVTLNKANNSLSVITESGSEITVFPDNLFQKLQGAESEQERLEEFAFHMRSLISSLDTAVERVDTLTSKDLNSIRTLVRHESLRNQSGDPGNPVLNKPFVGDLRIFIVVDTPTSVKYLVESRIADSGFTLDVLIARGLRNLKGKPETEDLGSGLKALFYDGTYEASFLLDTKFWHRLFERTGAFYMIVPARDIIVYSLDDSRQSKQAILALHGKIQDGVSYPLSDKLYVRQADGWKVAR